jgi:hypothetical protein
MTHVHDSAPLQIGEGCNKQRHAPLGWIKERSYTQSSTGFMRLWPHRTRVLFFWGVWVIVYYMHFVVSEWLVFLTYIVKMLLLLLLLDPDTYLLLRLLPLTARGSCGWRTGGGGEAGAGCWWRRQVCTLLVVASLVSRFFSWAWRKTAIVTRHAKKAKEKIFVVQVIVGTVDAYCFLQNGPSWLAICISTNRERQS